MSVDLVAAHPHYHEHLEPIFMALPPALRGRRWLGGRQREDFLRQRSRLCLVAGWDDVRHIQMSRHKMIYVEHGAGQQYSDMPGPGYSGTDRHNAQVVGYICPSDTVAERWAPKPAVAVGCPKLDAYVGRPAPPASIDPVVVITWHWNCMWTKETRPALPHYRGQLGQIVERFRAQGFTVAGHAHPRWGRDLDPMYGELEVPILTDGAQALSHADILVADNTSLMYEAAALGVQVIALNAPWYRREVDHGLRFWSHVPGIQVDGPDELLDMDLTKAWVMDPGADARRKAVAHAYAHTDGSSAQRAADFVVEIYNGLTG